MGACASVFTPTHYTCRNCRASILYTDRDVHESLCGDEGADMAALAPKASHGDGKLALQRIGEIK